MHHRTTLFRTATVATLVATGLLGACASGPEIEERPSLSPIEPIARPAYTVGTVLRQVSAQDGDVADWEILEAREDGSYVGRNVEGCTWTTALGPHSPAVEWTGCGTGEWSGGTRTILSSKGELWPLAPGNKASWRHEFESSRGSPSSGTRTCKVTGPYAIAARVGEVDALKVRCRDPWGVTTTYWAAEYGEIRTFHVHNERGLEYDHELVAVERP